MPTTEEFKCLDVAGRFTYNNEKQQQQNETPTPTTMDLLHIS